MVALADLDLAATGHFDHGAIETLCHETVGACGAGNIDRADGALAGAQVRHIHGAGVVEGAVQEGLRELGCMYSWVDAELAALLVRAVERVVETKKSKRRYEMILDTKRALLLMR